MNSCISKSHSTESFIRDSGVPWIGTIPYDWDVQPLKRVISCMDGKRVPIDASARISGPYPYWGAGNIVDHIDQYLFDEELVLLGEDGAPFFDKTRPVAFHINEKVWVNNHIHVLKAKGIDPSYLTYVLNSVDYHEYISGSILPKLTQSDMNSILIPVPPISDQKKIAEYISSKCKLINSIIDSQNELKSRLYVLKQSIISEAVTSCDNYKNVKNTKIDGLRIPDDWDFITLNKLIKFKNNGVTRRDLIQSSQGEIVLRLKDITDDGIDFSNPQRINLSESEKSKYELKDGDILFVRVNGSKQLVGKSAVFHSTTEPIYFNDHVIRISVSDVISPDFLQLYLKSSIGKLEISTKIKTSAGQYTISGTDLGSIMIPLPSFEQQLQILKDVTKILNSIGQAMDNIEKEINIVKEYRSSLIYEYATGKKIVPSEASL